MPERVQRREGRECCDDLSLPHAEPHVDEIGLRHGERAAICDDPPPWGACLCGHPDYLSCAMAYGPGSIVTTALSLDGAGAVKVEWEAIPDADRDALADVIETVRRG